VVGEMPVRMVEHVDAKGAINLEGLLDPKSADAHPHEVHLIGSTIYGTHTRRSRLRSSAPTKGFRTHRSNSGSET